MTTKEYLEQVKKLDRLIVNKFEEINRLREASKSISIQTGCERIKTTGKNDKIGDAVSKIVDLEQELEEKINEYIEKREKIIDEIERIVNPDYYHILAMRYINHLTFDEISLKSNWSIRKVFAIHKKALAAFDEMMKKRQKYAVICS